MGLPFTAAAPLTDRHILCFAGASPRVLETLLSAWNGWRSPRHIELTVLTKGGHCRR